MPTFYDPIELENIDIDDNAASFYLIELKNNAGFKFCATTQKLDSSNLVGGDPVTRINEYWPITREQLNQANLAVLFPNDHLRAAPLSLKELNEAFHFNPPFNPTTPKMIFGQPQPQSQLPVVMAEAVGLQQKREKIIRDATALGMSPEQIAVITFRNSFVEKIYSEKIPLNELITLNTLDQSVVGILSSPGLHVLWQSLPTESYAFRDIVLLINGARNADMPYNRIISLIDIGWNMDAVRLGVWDLNLLSSVDDDLFSIIVNGFAQEMVERLYSLQEYIDLYNHLKEELHMTLGEIKVFLWSDGPKNLFQAIHNGSTSFDRLSHLSLEELNDAIAHDDYPEAHQNRLR